jgi:hypothetical protein
LELQQFFAAVLAKTQTPIELGYQEQYHPCFGKADS